MVGNPSRRRSLRTKTRTVRPGAPQSVQLRLVRPPTRSYSQPKATMKKQVIPNPILPAAGVRRSYAADCDAGPPLGGRHDDWAPNPEEGTLSPEGRVQSDHSTQSKALLRCRRPFCNWNLQRKHSEGGCKVGGACTLCRGVGSGGSWESRSIGECTRTWSHTAEWRGVHSSPHLHGETRPRLRQVAWDCCWVRGRVRLSVGFASIRRGSLLRNSTATQSQPSWSCTHPPTWHQMRKWRSSTRTLEQQSVVSRRITSGSSGGLQCKARARGRTLHFPSRYEPQRCTPCNPSNGNMSY